MAKVFRIIFIFVVFIVIGLFVNDKIVQAVDLPEQAISHMPVCPPGNQETPRCHAQVSTEKSGKAKATTSPTGLTPAQFLAAYNLSGSVSTPTTVAIVDAYDDPNISSDLNTFSTTFGIQTLNSCPVATGTDLSPCFQKVDQLGGTSYPAVNSGWALETSLDVETVHALCQNCNILLVEAKSNSYSDLMAAEDRALMMGAKIVSNSYGSGEFSTEKTFDNHLNVPGVAFTFSSGDNGYGAEYPASSKYVTAVGGTTLNMSGLTYLGESAWNGSGSGCSSYENKPSWQTDSGCPKRTVADVSADADPSTGASVYDTVPYSGQTGWFKVGGTSLSSPIIAATFALAGDSSLVSSPNSLPYLRQSYGVNLRDVLTGSNGHCKRTAYLCTSLSGYDGPTGLGTPLGVTAF